MESDDERGHGPVRRTTGILRRRLPLPGWAAVAALLLSSCHLIGSFKTGPEGQSPHDTDLRRLAREERFHEAVELTDPDERSDIGDELLRLMHRGLLLHYAGEYEASNEAFQRAELMIEERYTRSLSLALLSIVTSDRALAWLPNDAERLMVNYYGALNYLALGEPVEAAVEARRLSRQLELSENDDIDAAEAELRRALRYFAGSVFEASGDRNNAAVAYRHVWRSTALPRSETTLFPRFLDLYGDLDPPAGPGGDVVILLELGFVAHRVEQSLNVPLFPGEADALHDGDSDVRFAAASCVAARAFADVWDFSRLPGAGGEAWSRGPDGRCIVPGARASRLRHDDQEGDEDGESHPFYLMRVAWPQMVRSGPPGDMAIAGLSITSDVTPLSGPAAMDTGPVPVELGPAGIEGRAAADGMRASLSGAVTEQFDRQLGGMLVKTVARTAVKYEIARALERELDKEDEALGDIAFLTANAAAALLERADTRCWHLLPDQLSIVRLRLPAGRHPLTLHVSTGRGGARFIRRPDDTTGRRIDLGEVEVRDGSVRVVSARVWP